MVKRLGEDQESVGCCTQETSVACCPNTPVGSVGTQSSEPLTFWKSERSNLLIHYLVFGVLAVTWPVATIFGAVYAIAFLAHISMAAFLYAVWGAIETSKMAVKKEFEETS